MRHLLFATAISFAAIIPATTTPVLAQSAPEAPAEDGRGLMERGAHLFLDGLMQEVDPTLRELRHLVAGMEPGFRAFVTQMGPALRDLLAEVEDWSAYHPPQRLDNGDIILRRKRPDPPALAPPAPGETDI